eukprot:TRINITY_DN870_c0_g1_i2.p1 TRINITY_DN870_c0_g1~~TRINITY_DN870_c0_g1_i2.p1  ORF type:complete len:580 (+),score=120.59 TRINITY_DN870_c0_g1_i2:949-2688(+)
MQSQSNMSSDPDLDLVNMLSELYLSTGQWKRATTMISTVHRIIARSLPIDLTVNYGICQVYLKNIEEANSQFDILLKFHDVNNYGDLFFNVAETFTAVGMPLAALPFYAKLTLNPEYNKPFIWLKQAQCLKDSHQIDAAISIYEKVLEDNDVNSEAVVALSELYRATDQPDRAIEIVNQYISSQRKNGDVSSTSDGHLNLQLSLNQAHASGETSSIQLPSLSMLGKIGVIIRNINDIGVLVQKGFLDYSISSYDSFLSVCYPIAGDESLRVGKPKRLRVKGETSGKKKKGRKRKRDEEEVEEESPDLNSIFRLLGPSTYYLLVLRVAQVLDYMNRSAEATQLLNVVLKYGTSLESYRFTTEQIIHLKWLGVTCAMRCGDYSSATRHVRYLCTLNPYKISVWNAFVILMEKAKNYSLNHPYMKRLLKKHPDCVPLYLMVGHHYQTAAYYPKLALTHYLKAYQISNHKIPLLCLNIGIAFLNLVMNKTTEDRHGTIIKAFTFLYEYYNLRNRGIEALYNLARGFHQLGLVQFATPLYEKALKMTDDPHNIKMEVAFNLSLIYRASGSTVLAHNLLLKYLVV